MKQARSRLRLRYPWHCLASGFGAGLSPVMPGSVGTLAAILLWYLLWYLLNPLFLPFLWLWLLPGIAGGVYICGKTARDLGSADPGCIVWDEFVGIWIVLIALPANNWQWVMAGFVIFRILDIVKPGPVGWCDRNVSGGLGIMLDDIVAGVMTAGTLYLAGLII